MLTLCPFLTMPCLVVMESVIVAFLGHTPSFFETIKIVVDSTIVLHTIEL